MLRVRGRRRRLSLPVIASFFKSTFANGARNDWDGAIHDQKAFCALSAAPCRVVRRNEKRIGVAFD
jgi:hypothetical protein